MYHLTPERLGLPRLLVLEDVAAMRIAIMRLLEPFVHLDLMGVSSVPVARQSIREQMPAAILLDIRLPEEMGTVLFREIRTNQWPIRVILWSGIDSSDDQMAEAMELHPDVVLPKPTPLADLIAALMPVEPHWEVVTAVLKDRST